MNESMSNTQSPNAPFLAAFAVRRPQSHAGYSIAVFGAMALLLGVASLIEPEIMLRSAGAPTNHPVLFVRISAMAATNMGVYYVLAAAAEMRSFFVWTVPFRVLTASVFTSMVVAGVAPMGMLGVAAWELAGATATAIALRSDRNRMARGSEPPRAG
jgi:hypothetical protein